MPGDGGRERGGMAAPSFDLDAHGRLAPRTDEARRALADRAGRFVLLPSASDLLVARRTPAIGGAAPRPRCILAGDLAGFPIADFLAFVHQSRLTGVLTTDSAALFVINRPSTLESRIARLKQKKFKLKMLKGCLDQVDGPLWIYSSRYKLCMELGSSLADGWGRESHA